MNDQYLLSVSSIQSFSGPALVLDAQGGIVESGSDSTLLEYAIETADFQRLRQVALNNNCVVSDQIVDTSSGEVVHLDLTILPMTNDGLVVLGRNITLETSLRTALVDSRQRFKDLVEISSDFAWEVGENGHFVFVSPRGAIGYQADELVGSRPGDFVLQRTDEQQNIPFLSRTRVESEEVWMVCPDGEPSCLMVSCLPLINDDGKWVGARGVCRDVTVERERDAALARAYHRDQLLAYIVKTVRDEVQPENMLGTAANAIARALGANGCRIFRADPDTGFSVSAHFGDALDNAEQLAEEMCHFRESDVREKVDGDWRMMMSATHYRREVNGGICLYRTLERGEWSDDDRILISDVANQLGIANEQISNHERIVRLSRTDALTGLLNRRAFFEDELPRRIMRLERDGRQAALVYVDLDNFKLVNDAFGHQRGDEALLCLRDYLEENTRPGDVVARLGGDEFAIWYDGMDEETACGRASALIEGSGVLDQFSASRERPLGFSLGVAVFNPKHGETIEALLSRADEAMYAVKHGGKGDFRLAKAANAV